MFCRKIIGLLFNLFVVYQLKYFFVDAYLSADQKKCFDNIITEFEIPASQQRIRSEYAKNGFLKHRIRDIDPKETTFQTDDAIAYFLEILKNMIPPNDSMLSMKDFCQMYGDVKKETCNNELKSYIPCILSKNIDVLQWIYKNLALRDIQTKDEYAIKYMESAYNNFFVDDKTLKLPATFCINRHRPKY